MAEEAQNTALLLGRFEDFSIGAVLMRPSATWLRMSLITTRVEVRDTRPVDGGTVRGPCFSGCCDPAAESCNTPRRRRG